MGRVAFIFPGSGQRDLSSDMWRKIYNRYESARQIFDLCDWIRPGTFAQCFWGNEKELKNTAVFQPCLFAAEMAAVEVLKAYRIVPDTAAGFSHGEIAACTLGGAFSIEQGFRLVMKRGEMMKEAGDGNLFFKASVLNLKKEDVKQICYSVGGVYTVSFDSSRQTTVAGYERRKDLFEELVKSAGGALICAQTGDGGHTPVMRRASAEMDVFLNRVSVRETVIPVYSNVTALPFKYGMKDLMARQIVYPVLWEDTVKNMIRGGVDTFIEIGTGNTLTGLIRKIDSTVRVYSLSDIPSLLREVRIF